MNYNEFAETVKAKYPQYADRDNRQLAQAMVKKFPQYGDRVAFDPAPQPEITKSQAALQAVGETLGEDLPVVGKAVGAIRESIPEKIAAVGGRLGVPRLGAAIGAGVGTVGELLPKTGGELALAGPGTAAIKGIARMGAKAAPSIISFLTRIERPIVERGISRAASLGNKELRSPEVIENAIKGLGESIQSGRSELGKKLGSIQDAISAGAGNAKIVQTAGIGVNARAKLAQAGFDVPGLPRGKVVRPLSQDTQVILKDLQNKNLSFQDAVNLRRKIDDLVQFKPGIAPKVDDTQAALLKQTRKQLNEQILKVNPKFKRANDAFAKAAQAYDEISRDLLSGKIETVQSRISKLFNKGSVERRLAQKVDKLSAGASKQLDTILDAFTAQKFAPIINPGVRRSAENTGGGLMPYVAGGLGTMLLGPLGATGIGAAGLAATSPRLAALAIRAAKSPISVRVPQALQSAAKTAKQAIPLTASLAALAAARKRNKEEAR